MAPGRASRNAYRKLLYECLPSVLPFRAEPEILTEADWALGPRRPAEGDHSLVANNWSSFVQLLGHGAVSASHAQAACWHHFSVPMVTLMSER